MSYMVKYDWYNVCKYCMYKLLIITSICLMKDYNQFSHLEV